MRQLTPSLLLLLIPLISFFIINFVFIYSQTPPDWCGRVKTVQDTPGFGHCLPLSQNNKPTRFDHSSWCKETNHFASISISFKDRDYKNNCTHPNAHCFATPKNSFNQETCVDGGIANVKFENSSRTVKSCKVVNYALPLEIKKTADTEKKFQFSVVSTQRGLLVVDLEKEQVVAESDIAIDNSLNFEFLSHVSTNYNNFAYIVAVRNKKVIVYSISFSSVNGDFQGLKKVAEGDVIDGASTDRITDVKTFYDGTSNAMVVAVLIANDAKEAKSIRFYTLTQPITGNPFTTPYFSWNLKFENDNINKRSLKLGYQRWIQPNKGAVQNSLTPSCFAATAERSLVIVSTDELVFIFGYPWKRPDPINREITIGEPSSKGKYLFYATSEDYKIHSVASFGECMGNFGSTSQQIWLAVGISNGINNRVHLAPLVEFTDTDISTCLTDQRMDEWTTNPVLYRQGGTCTKLTLACNQAPNQYAFHKGGPNCFDRKLTHRSVSGNPKQIVARIRPDNKETTLDSDVEFAWVTHLFVLSNTKLDVLYYQERACNENLDPKFFGDFASIPFSETVEP